MSSEAIPGRRFADDRSANAEVGWVTEAKDWAGELISGQTTTGRILVSTRIIIFAVIIIPFADHCREQINPAKLYASTITNNFS